MVSRIWDVRRSIGLAVLAALLVGSSAVAGGSADARQVVLVRHAEKAADDPRDPSLTAAGKRRAEALATILGSAGVTHLFCSEFRRTRDTLAPLASSRGLELTVVPAREPTQLVAALHALPAGAVAVVAGHSNTVPELVHALGGPVGSMTDEQYDRLFLLVLPAQGAGPALSTVELRYGD